MLRGIRPASSAASAALLLQHAAAPAAAAVFLLRLAALRLRFAALRLRFAAAPPARASRERPCSFAPCLGGFFVPRLMARTARLPWCGVVCIFLWSGVGRVAGQPW